MLRQRVVLFIVLLIAIAVILVAAVSAQNITGVQQWEYSLVFWTPKDNSFQFLTSNIYEGLEFVPAIAHETTQGTIDALQKIGEVVLIDYLAIMGVSGYELVDVTILDDPFVYTFKRPIKQ